LLPDQFLGKLLQGARFLAGPGKTQQLMDARSSLVSGRAFASQARARLTRATSSFRRAGIG
jgi:hypothetical protein